MDVQVDVHPNASPVAGLNELELMPPPGAASVGAPSHRRRAPQVRVDTYQLAPLTANRHDITVELQWPILEDRRQCRIYV